MDFSIVIPTWNRSELVQELLSSLFEDRKDYTGGKTEVLVVDSSIGEEQAVIQKACQDFDARYIEGDSSVRKKRNLGIWTAQYDMILFIDSDVKVKKGLLASYEKAWEHYRKTYPGMKIGGILGYTEFTGKRSFWWRMLEQTSLVNSFSFAKLYPFQSWTIGNNVSYRKDVLFEIGLFEENFPFRLGGDDLDLSYRVTKAGYRIGSCPEAVTFHSRKTWNNAHAIHDRAKRWGTMEWYINKRHPELDRRVIPKNYVLMTPVILLSLLLTALTGNSVPLFTALVWLLFEIVFSYLKCLLGGHPTDPVCFFGARIIEAQYEFYRIKMSLSKKSLRVFTHGQVFSRMQIRYGTGAETKRVEELLFSYTAILMAVLALVRFVPSLH